MRKFNISKGFVPVDYGYAWSHQYVGDRENIGVHGENLTIVVISCNRSALTIRLMNSLEKHIPDFEGEIILFDNASDKVELRNLEKKLAVIPFRYKLIKSSKNCGPAGGRNRAMKEVKTEWILSLDNDVYFISNPLKICRQNIASLGCMFLNLPLLSGDAHTVFANGGSLNVFTEGTDIHIWPGSMYEQVRCSVNEEFMPSLSTFLFGGASIINREVFIQCGCFDEGLFIGFEDIDFSITLFKKGYKIGSAGILALVHDHKRLKTESSMEYEKVRFSDEIILKDALYFEKKHKLNTWKSTAGWLQVRREELGINSVDSDALLAKDSKAVPIKKRSILFCIYTLASGGVEKLIIDLLHRLDAASFDIDLCVEKKGHVYEYDLPDYVNYFVYNELQSYPPEKYDVEIAFLEGTPTKIVALRQSSAVKIAWIHTDKYESRLSAHPYINENEEAMCYSMMDHLIFVSQNTMKQFDKLFPCVQTNKSVFYNFINKEHIIDKSKSITGSVEKTKLTMCTIGRLVEVKGVDRLIPILSRLKKDGLDFHHWLIGDGPQKGDIQLLIEQYDLQDTVFLLGFQKNPWSYLKASDIFVLVSHVEGLPLVVAEALCLGKPILATNVAGTAELLDYGKHGMLVDSNDEAIYKGLKEMMSNENLRNTYASKAASESATDMIDMQKALNRINDLLLNATSGKTPLNRIAHYLFIDDYSNNNPGLMDGKMGRAIFFFHYASFTGNKIYKDYAFGLIDEMTGMIHNETPLDYADGLAGIGAGIEYLVQNGFIEADTDEILEEIEQNIHQTIHTMTNGTLLAGTGRYLLFRLKKISSDNDKPITLKNKDCLIQIIDLIERLYPQQSKDSLDCIFRFLTEVDKTNIYSKKVKHLIKEIKSTGGHFHTDTSYRRNIEQVICRQYKEIITNFQNKKIPKIQAYPYGGLTGMGLYLMGELDSRHKSWLQLL